MHERAAAPVNAVVPPARRLPPPPTLIRNSLDRGLARLIASPPKRSSPRRRSPQHQPTPPAASPHESHEHLRPVPLDTALATPRRGAATKLAVDRSTVASTARTSARKSEFPCIDVHRPSPSPGAGSTPRRHTSKPSSSAGTPRRDPSPTLTESEAKKRAVRMRFFADQNLFTQPFRSEFRAANLAPPSDNATLPSVARALVGAKPYAGFATLGTVVTPRRKRDDAGGAAEVDDDDDDEAAMMNRWVQ